MVTSRIWFPFFLTTDIDTAACKIRSAGVSDLAHVAEVLASSFYPPLGWRRWLYPLLRFSIHEDLKLRLQSASTPYRCLVAIAPVKNSTRTHIIGTVEMSRRHMGVWAFGRPQQIYLSNLAIAENCRRQGVARQLLQAAERQARDWGFRELYLHVMMDNLAARNLYQCMEYEVQSVETTLLSLVNVHAPRLLLRKSL